MEITDVLLLLILTSLLCFFGLLAGVTVFWFYRQRQYDKKLEHFALIFVPMATTLLERAMTPRSHPFTPPPFYRADVHPAEGVPVPPRSAPADMPPDSATGND